MDEKKPANTSNDMIRRTISVPGDHPCRNDPDTICPVSPIATNDLLFVSNKRYPACPYYIPFGYSGFCNLSIRKEIYQKFKK